MPELVVASVASIPSREALLARVVASLKPQVDRLYVYLNGYEDVPRFLRDDTKIHIAGSGAHGDRGDAGKFFWACTFDGYHLTCDDDLGYPPNYVEQLVAGVERYGRRALVGVHGAVLLEPYRNYIDSRQLYHSSARLFEDRPCHILGTGTLCYHTETLALAPKHFPIANMADVFLAVAARSRGVALVALKRQAGWLRTLRPQGATIYERTRREGTEHLDALIEMYAPWLPPELP